MVTHYQREKAIPMIISLMKKHGYNITEENIKIWTCDVMRINDVVRGCNRVKSINSPILVYTNKVPILEILEKNERVTIFDIEKLKELCLKVNDYDLYDLLT